MATMTESTTATEEGRVTNTHGPVSWLPFSIHYAEYGFGTHELDYRKGPIDDSRHL